LPAEISRLSALRVLSATGNQLKELPETIQELENLQCLHLNENCLRELPLFLSKLRRLEIVDATGNGIDSWKKGFGEQLLELRLDENRLSTLPKSLSCMKNLKVLELGDNNLTSLPDDIGSLMKLEILNLSQNNMTELPASIGDLPSLKILDLSGNHIEDLPESFQSAGVIESFFMEKNYVKTLPSWCGSLCNIVNLGMADNQLVGNPLPDNFGSVSGKSLRTLDLSGNNISQLPDSVGELKHLEKLQLGSTICELERRAFQNGNWLHSLPNSFGWMINLQKLHLDENLLTELPENFGSLENLEWADFGQNRLRKLPESFCSLTRLWFLQLSFANLTNLQTLDLFHNELTKIPKQLLNLKKLLRLDLDKNQFKLKAEKVPKLTKQVKYPSRDPNLKNNWRGKTREDYVEPDEEKTVQILNEVDEEEEDYQDDDTDEEEITYSEAALEFAMKRSLSIWKSHEGPDERKVKNRNQITNTSIPSFTTYQSTSSQKREETIMECSKGFYSEIFEDADVSFPKESNLKNLDTKENHPDVTVGSVPQHDEISSNSNLDVTEDWDEEIQDSLAYNVVLETFKERSRNKVFFQNQLQNLLYSYPPACQAFTKTANYESAVYCSPISAACSMPFLCPSNKDTAGQFDDADEDD
ncbi:unnamed protein product, partial [Porites evermanni]